MKSSTHTRVATGGILAAAAVAAFLAMPPAFATAAAASEMMGTSLGTSTGEVSANLKAKGYEVRRFENEDGMIEGYATKDGNRYEVYVDPKTGKVARFKKVN